MNVCFHMKFWKYLFPVILSVLAGAHVYAIVRVNKSTVQVKALDKAFHDHNDIMDFNFDNVSSSFDELEVTLNKLNSKIEQLNHKVYFLEQELDEYRFGIR